MDDSFYSAPVKIPGLLDIVKIESPSWQEDKTEGPVYIYYYPKGLAQEISIHFLRKDGRGRWILYLDPVTKNIQILKIGR